MIGGIPSSVFPFTLMGTSQSMKRHRDESLLGALDPVTFRELGSQVFEPLAVGLVTGPAGRHIQVAALLILAL